MLLLERKAKLKWNNANKKRYINLGYNFTKNGEEFYVEIEHLTPTTRAFVWTICDYCKINEKQVTYKNYITSNKNSFTKKDVCSNCKILKQTETNLIKYGAVSPTCNEEIKKKVRETTKKNYGVEYNTQSEIVKNKVKETVLEKYGVENVFSNSDIIEKIIETNNEKYGVDYYNQTEEHKQRSKATNLLKYGFEFSSQNPEIKEKIRKTNNQKYGVPVPTQNIEIQKKIRKTLFENNTAPTSKQQKYLHSLIGGELNFPIGNISADIALIEENILIEYDGGGHWLSVIHGNITMDEFVKKERKRQYFLIRQGWKIIRIISKNDLLPNDYMLSYLIERGKDYLNKNNKHWVNIDVDNSKFICSLYEQEIDLGLLRKIS